MRHIHETIAGKNVGLITAHPDDNLTQALAVIAAQEVSATVHELTLTQGKQGQNFRSANPDFVKNGGRVAENEAAASLLGISTVEQWDYPDGELHTQSGEIIPRAQKWLVRHGIGVLLTMGGLYDHTDHQASARIARGAAGSLWETDHLLDVLELRQDGAGDWHAPTSSRAVRTAFTAAAAHESQFLISRVSRPDWPAIDDDLFAHPQTLSGLDQYPIRCDAAYVQLTPALLGLELELTSAQTGNDTVY